jgi:hypothetical protein
MGFAFLLTWQNPGMDWHICKLTIDLAFRLTHYSHVRSSLPRRRVSFFRFWQVNFTKPLEITFFSPPYINLRVGKLHLLPNKKCKTVGVALIFLLVGLARKMSTVFASCVGGYFFKPKHTYICVYVTF